MKILLISIISCFILISCKSESKSLEEVIVEIDKSEYLMHYEDYYLTPIHRRMNVLVVKTRGDGEYFVRDFYHKKNTKMKISKCLHPSSESQFINDSDLHNDIYNFLADSYDLDILRYVNTGRSVVIHVNVLCKIDGENSSKVKYVLVKSDLQMNDCQNDLSISKKVYDLNSPLHKISNGWYYYTSDLFNKYNDLEDFN